MYTPPIDKLHAAILPHVHYMDGQPFVGLFHALSPLGMRYDATKRLCVQLHNAPDTPDVVLRNLPQCVSTDLLGRSKADYAASAFGFRYLSTHFTGKDSRRIRPAFDVIADVLDELAKNGQATSFASPTPTPTNIPVMEHMANGYSIDDILKLIDGIELTDPIAKQSLAGQLLGVNIPAPIVEQTYSATEISEMYKAKGRNISKATVGQLGQSVQKYPDGTWRVGDTGVMRAVDMPPGPNGEWRTPRESWRYNRKGLRELEPLIEKWLAERGR